MSDEQDDPRMLGIRATLAGRRVLITGATGFLAKVILEKLVRDVPEIGGVVLLIRGSAARPTARERFEAEVAPSTVFDRLRRERPEAFAEFCRDKVECVTGEVTQPGFGLEAERYADLAARVDVVVHAAASVEFRDDLERALAINALSLLTIAAFVRAAGDVPLVHVSTCYVNGFHTGACHEEPVTPARGCRGARWNDGGFFEVGPLVAELEEKIARVTARTGAGPTRSDRLVELGIREARRRGWNDTYTFTKWIGEQLVSEAVQDGTLSIVRPSIIESTLREPVPGWVEGVKVADAIILAYARGRATFFPARLGGVVDLVPADLAANGVILALAEALAAPGRRRIYQCATGSTNPLTLGRMCRLLQAEVNRNHAAYPRLFSRGRPRRDMRMLDPGVFVLAMTTLRWWLGLRETCSRLLGRRPRVRRASIATNLKLAVTFSFYTAPRCIFHNDRLQALAARLAPDERAVFPVDGRGIAWEDYLGPSHLAGLDRYALPDRAAVVAAGPGGARAADPPAVRTLDLAGPHRRRRGRRVGQTAPVPATARLEGAMPKKSRPRRSRRPVTDVDAAYVCDSCGEEIVVPVDISAGTRQDYVEDCPVCCHPMRLHVEIGRDGEARIEGEHE